jgi:hypothetical protein
MVSCLQVLLPNQLAPLHHGLPAALVVGRRESSNLNHAMVPVLDHIASMSVMRQGLTPVHFQLDLKRLFTNMGLHSSTFQLNLNPFCHRQTDATQRTPHEVLTLSGQNGRL